MARTECKLSDDYSVLYHSLPQLFSIPCRATLYIDARRPGAKLSKVGDYSRRAINKTTTFVMGAPATRDLVINDYRIIYANNYVFTYTYGTT